MRRPPSQRDLAVSAADTNPSAFHAINLAVKFGLELGMLAALAYWGSRTGPLATNIALGVCAPALGALAWGTFAAPRSSRRLPELPRLVFESGMFLTSAVALAAAGAFAAGIAFAAVVLVNTLLLRI